MGGAYSSIKASNAEMGNKASIRKNLAEAGAMDDKKDAEYKKKYSQYYLYINLLHLFLQCFEIGFNDGAGIKKSSDEINVAHTGKVSVEPATLDAEDERVVFSQLKELIDSTPSLAKDLPELKKKMHLGDTKLQSWSQLGAKNLTIEGVLTTQMNKVINKGIALGQKRESTLDATIVGSGDSLGSTDVLRCESYEEYIQSSEIFSNDTDAVVVRKKKIHEKQINAAWNALEALGFNTQVKNHRSRLKKERAEHEKLKRLSQGSWFEQKQAKLITAKKALSNNPKRVVAAAAMVAGVTAGVPAAIAAATGAGLIHAATKGGGGRLINSRRTRRTYRKKRSRKRYKKRKSKKRKSRKKTKRLTKR